MPDPKPRFVTHPATGETLELKEWAARLGLPPNTIRARLDKLRWPVEKALTAPADKRFSKRGKKRAAAAPRPVPEMRRHPNGKAWARWWEHGRERSRYFGEWNTEDARDSYRRFAAEWLASGHGRAEPGEPISIAELIERYLPQVEQYYRKHGKPTGQYPAFVAAYRRLNSLYGDTLASEFGPRQLKAYRASLIDEGLTRTTTNQHVWRVRKLFSFAVAEELIPPEVYQILTHVPDLQAGRTNAPEGVRLTPAPLASIRRTLPHLHPRRDARAVFIAAIRVQLLTGMRAGELLSMRPIDIDRTVSPWTYRPARHKTEHHTGRGKTIRIGPRAQRFLRVLVARCPDPSAPVFAYSRAADRPPQGIAVSAYALRIREACRRAGIPEWHSHQLRSTYADTVRKRFESSKVAADAIGDTEDVLNEVYAADPGEAARARIANVMG